MGFGGADVDVVAEGFVGAVIAVFVGEDPGDASIGGGVDEFSLLFWWGADAHSDDEGFLALQGGDDGGVVVVVDLFDGDAGGELGGTAFAGDGGDVLFAVGEKGFDNVFAACAGCLDCYQPLCTLMEYGLLRTPTMATFLI